MRQVCEQLECEPVEFNGEDNHVHLLANFPPKVALSKLVNSLNGVSSRYLRRDLPEVRRYFWPGARLWSGSYFAGTIGGAPLSVLRQYIEQQNRPASRDDSNNVRATWRHEPENHARPFCALAVATG